MVNGNGQVTDLDEAVEDRCVRWEQLNCKQGHRQHYTTIRIHDNNLYPI